MSSKIPDEIASLSNIISIAIIVVVIATIGIGAAFALSGASPSHSTSTSSFPSVSSIFTSSSVVLTSSSSTSTTSTHTSLTAESYRGMLGYNPSCFALYSGAVHVFGTISPSASGNVKSVELWWSYHEQNKWYPLNDLVLGPSFSDDGNFSHMWNPPSAAYYDFEANWTLSNGQTITGTTSQPFQVVSQDATCP